MELKYGWWGKVLWVDLEAQTFEMGTLYMQLEKSPYDLEFFIGTISNRPAVG